MFLIRRVCSINDEEPTSVRPRVARLPPSQLRVVPAVEVAPAEAVAKVRLFVGEAHGHVGVAKGLVAAAG